MAKAKTAVTASEWLTIESGPGQPMLVAPLETALRWRGDAPSSRIRITFGYWQNLQAQLPAELRPSGKPDTPHITVDSEAKAKARVDKLRAWILERHPNMKVKKQKELTRFVVPDGDSYWLTVAPESDCDLLDEKLADKTTLVFPHGSSAVVEGHQGQGSACTDHGRRDPVRR